MDCSCAVYVHLYCGFSLWRQMAPQQSANFKTTFFGQFRTSLRKDSIANYASIWKLFSLFVRGPNLLCNALNILQFRQQVAPPESLICGNIPKRRNSATQLCEILRILTIYIVINSIHVQLHMRVTISCRYCIALDVMLLFLVYTVPTDGQQLTEKFATKSLTDNFQIHKQFKLHQNNYVNNLTTMTTAITDDQAWRYFP